MNTAEGYYYKRRATELEARIAELEQQNAWLQERLTLALATIEQAATEEAGGKEYAEGCKP